MPVRLKIDRSRVTSFDEELITLGSDPTCVIPLPACIGLAPRHAVIRKIAGRWIVEVREGDSIRVGDGEPTRLHWLSSGDVIRLSDGAPVVTFEPEGADIDSSPTPRPAGTQPTSYSTTSVVRPTLRFEALTSTPPPAAPSPSPKTPVSEDDRNSLPLSKPRQLFTPPFENPVELTNQNPKPPVMPSPDAKSTKPTARAERKVANAPPVAPAATASLMLPGSQSSAARKRRGQAQQRFWMQIGGGAALFVVVLAVWYFGSPPSKRRPPEEPTTTEMTPNDIPSTHESGGTTEKPVVVASTPPKSKSNTTTPSPPTKTSTTSTSGTDDGRVASNSPPTKSRLDQSQNSLPLRTETSETKQKEMSDDEAAAPSATLTVVREGIFAVYAQHSDQEHAFRVGTAWAATRRQLVTTGAVAMAVEELKRQGLNIFVSNPANERPIPIKGIQVNPAYKSAVDRANVAKQQIAAEPTGSPPKKSSDSSDPTPEVQLAKAFADQARFDLGLLEIAMGERLKSTLNMDSSWSPDVSASEFDLIGFPFPADQYVRSTPVTSDDPQERRCRAGGTHRSEKDLTLVMEFPKNVKDQNWSGSPVFNATHRVIGVYSRPASSPNGQAPPPQHAIIWLGRLREFAAEFDN